MHFLAPSGVAGARQGSWPPKGTAVWLGNCQLIIQENGPEAGRKPPFISSGLVLQPLHAMFQRSSLEAWPRKFVCSCIFWNTSFSAARRAYPKFSTHVLYLPISVSSPIVPHWAGSLFFPSHVNCAPPQWAHRVPVPPPTTSTDCSLLLCPILQIEWSCITFMMVIIKTWFRTFPTFPFTTYVTSEPVTSAVGAAGSLPMNWGCCLTRSWTWESVTQVRLHILVSK